MHLSDRLTNGSSFGGMRLVNVDEVGDVGPQYDMRLAAATARCKTVG